MITQEVYEYTRGYRPSAGAHRSKEEVFKERLEKAKTQEVQNVKSRERIIQLVKEFLLKYYNNAEGYIPVCVERKSEPFLKPYVRAKEYKKLKNEFKLFDKSHLVWMKFASNGDKTHLGVVAAGADINFDMDNTAGRIISELGYKWEEEKVLICPLPNIGDKERSDIECGIGNYLIKNEVPILDYYSHRYK